MGRPRITNLDLPTRVYFKHGAYYYKARANKLIRLGSDKDGAVEMFCCVADERDVRAWRERGNDVRRATLAKSSDLLHGIPVRWLSSIYRKSRQNALARKIPFRLALDDVHQLAKRADGKCEVSGIGFRFDEVSRRSKERVRMIWAPSIDRKDASKGYYFANTRLVCAAVNICLADWGDEVLFTIASSMVEKRRKSTPLAFENNGLNVAKTEFVEENLPQTVS